MQINDVNIIRLLNQSPISVSEHVTVIYEYVDTTPIF